MATIRVNNINLYYEWHGDAAAPVLVLNNGILMNAAASWAFQTTTLAKHYRVLQYDCRGQGQSDHPDEHFDMDTHAHDLAELLTGLGVEKAHLAGISYGGEVAQVFALRYPNRVLSLFLADTVSEVRAELKMVAEEWRARALAKDVDGFFRATVPWNFSAEFIAQHPQLIADARQRYKLLDMMAVARLCDAFLEVNLTERLGDIGAPTCIVVGECDILKGREYAELLHQHIRQSEMHILIGAGHASCWERAAEFNSVLLGFLAKQV